VLVWPLGLGVLAQTALEVQVLAGSSYGGSTRWLLWLQVAAGVALLTVATLRPFSGRALAVAVAGATWLVPELAGWTSGPAAATAAADAWSWLLPALIVVGLLAPDGRSRWAAAPVVLTVSSGVLLAGARLLAIDPFVDPECWRRCDHNPLFIAGTGGAGDAVAGIGAVLTATGAVWAAALCLAQGRSRLLRGRSAQIGASALAVGTVAPGVLRLAVPELPTHPAYLTCFLLAQTGAVALAVLATRDRLAQWWLSARLSRLAGALQSTPAPGALADALRTTVHDPRLAIRYWAAGRGGYVDAEGEPTEVPDGSGGRVTLVTRRGQPVAALIHSRDVDGERVDGALGPALRLALENEQLSAATLAELRALRQSRARIVEREQLERRRLERNLHDGAQQRAVSLALMVRMLAGGASGDSSAALLARAEALIRATVEELRRVARGIYPAVLADAGLAGAVVDLAESSTDLPIILDGLPRARYTGTVETTAYLVIAAAIAEARRCGATCVRVSGHERDGRLCIDLQDDAPPSAASLTELTDQVRALGGDISVQRAGAGTRVGLELPCGS
jgi:signal transduction histidine kinase